MSTNKPQRILNPWQRLLGEDFNLAVFLSIVRKSLVWLVLFLVFFLALVFIYLRYTYPTYESSTRLIYKQSEATRVLDFMGSREKTVFNDLEIIRSPIILRDAVENLPLKISYFQRGDILDDEFYRNSPFEVDIEVKDNRIYGTEINIAFEGSNTFSIIYNMGRSIDVDNAKFGELVTTPHFDAIFKKNEAHFNRYNPIQKVPFFFVVNSSSTVISRIGRSLSFERYSSGGQILKISMQDKLPSRANDVLNEIAQTYISYDLERQKQSSENILDFIETQLDTITRELRTHGDRLKDFKLSNKIINPENLSEQTLTEINKLEERKENLALQMQSLEWLEKYVRTDQTIAAISPELMDLEFEGFVPYLNQIRQVQDEIENKKLSLKESHLQIQYLEKQLKEAKENFFEYMEHARNRLQLQMDKANEELAEFNYRFQGMSQIESQYVELNRVTKRKEEYYLMLLDKQTQYEISRAGIVENYAVLREAGGGQKIAPRENLLKLGGLFTGIVFWLLLVAGRYLLQNRIQNSQELEDLTDVPLIGNIPRMKEVKDIPELIVYDNPKSLVTESFRSMRSNLEFIEVLDPPKTISITSTISGEGKTFAAINLAGIMNMAGKRVILLDMDLRKPKLHHVFNHENDKGVSTLLIGKHSIDDVLCKSSHAGLDFIPSGPIPPNPAELIISEKSKNVIKELRQNYDLVICDTPPVGLVADALELLKLSEFPIYIIRADFSRREFVNFPNRLYRENGIRQLSIVLNDIKLQRGGYGRYNYGYGYSYGSGYYDEHTKRSLWHRLFRR